MGGALNGYGGKLTAGTRSGMDRDAMIRRIENAIEFFGLSLIAYGFSEYEAGEVTLATRFAIMQIVKARAQGTGNG